MTWLDAKPAAAAASIIAVFLAVRLVSMLAVGFGNDDAYTLAGARTLRLSYFDHQPLHIWLAHLTSLLVGETLWVRLPFVLLFAATGWLLFLVTGHLYGPRAAVCSVLAHNLSIFFTVSAGGWVVPDGVLIFCLLAAVLALLPILVPKAGIETTSAWRPWLVAGLWFGLAGLSRYNAVLIALGLVAFVVSPRHRRWLAHPAPYVGALMALVILLLVLLWNARNGWVSFAFQTSRGLPQSALHPIQVLAMLAGEAALLSSWVAVPLLATLVDACRSPSRDADRLIWPCRSPSLSCSRSPCSGAHEASWEMIVVDDESTDGTWQWAREIGAKDARLRCLRRVDRRGLAGACIEGALSSSAQIVAVIDGDLQHDETILPAMWKLVADRSADLAIGTRVSRSGGDEAMSASRRWLSGVGRRSPDSCPSSPSPIRWADSSWYGAT